MHPTTGAGIHFLLPFSKVKTFFTMMSTNDSEVSGEFHGVMCEWQAAPEFRVVGNDEKWD